MNRDLDYVLNYMNKYTKDRFMQDSEPMLNSQDIKLVLNHIYELEQKINEAIEEITKNKYMIDISKVLDILRGEDNEQSIKTNI